MKSLADAIAIRACCHRDDAEAARRQAAAARVRAQTLAALAYALDDEADSEAGHPRRGFRTQQAELAAHEAAICEQQALTYDAEAERADAEAAAAVSRATTINWPI